MFSILFYVRSGALAWRLRDLIVGHCVKVVIAKSDLDPSPVAIDPGCIRPVGFDDDEMLLPHTGESASVYQDLLEYFAYPEWVPAPDVFGDLYDASQMFEDECVPTATEVNSWGAIKGLYR